MIIGIPIKDKPYEGLSDSLGYQKLMIL